jgi:uncharacterized damage-inducible protein DinB
MTAELLLNQFQASHSVLRRNLDGISHEESLSTPRDGSNSLNWVLGHLVATRNLVLDLLDQPSVLTKEQAVAYRGDGGDPSRFLGLEDLKAALERSQEAIHSGFQKLSSESMKARVYGSTVGEMLAVLSFHEGYHGGQIGIIRRSLGHAGVIKPPKLPPRNA